MFLQDQKLEARINELKEYRYRDIIPLDYFTAKEDLQGVVNPELPTEFENWDILKTGDTWKGRDKYLWLHKVIEIPESFQGKKALGIFDYGNTGGGNNSGFESLLYVDGKPYQGVDSNHKEVFFTEDMAGKKIDLTFRLWSGLEGGGRPVPQEHAIRRMDLAWLDEEVDDLYYLSAMVMDTIKILEDKDTERHELREALEKAMRFIDWSYPGSAEFYETLHQADEYLNGRIDSMDKNSKVAVKCVGHTHIDVAWLWQLKHTREKASRSFSTVLRLMEQYPEYIFLQTQPQLYEYIKKDFPEIFEKIREKVAEGKWEPDGAMWVEADCNLTSGESLTRQILIGSKLFREEFGKEVEYLWLPDVFGYSWSLPQILKKSGINMFMTTKISWNQYNRMPHDTFYWVGMDGSKVLTHFITTPEPWNEPGSWFYTYNGLLTPKTVKGSWEAYRDKDINKELLISYGYGDGGGGVNRDTLEQRRRIDKIPGLPSLKTSTAGEFFRDLKETVKNTDHYVHTWDGELYLEYHRGTYTSHAHNKRMNRKMELLYREAEWLTVMAGILKGSISDAKQEDLTEGWKMILTNQFHDIIPGSSIREVYEQSAKDYEAIAEIALKVEEDAFNMLLRREERAVTVINNSSWSRDEIIEVKEMPGILTDAKGNSYPVQKDRDTLKVLVKDVPALGFKTLYWRAGTPSDKQENKVFAISKEVIETPFYTLHLNADGQITGIYDKEYNREVMKPGDRGNVLQVFEDKPLNFDAWDIDIFYQEKMKEVTELTSFEIAEEGPLRAVIRLSYRFQSSVINQDIILYADNRRIDFKTKVDYHERRQLLKVAFPVDIRSTYATYDIQYGNVRRANNWNTSWEQAKFETVAHRWVDLSERGYGVSLLNDCKYGHDIKENVLRLTLIKAAIHPDYEQDQGLHEFTYSLYPHGGDFAEGGTVKEAYALNQPLTLLEDMASKEGSFIMVDNEWVEVDALKRSEDGKSLVIRFHEYTGSRQNVNIKFSFPVAGYRECDLMERPMEERKELTEITTDVKPYEIKTYLVEIG